MRRSRVRSRLLGSVATALALGLILVQGCSKNGESTAPAEEEAAEVEAPPLEGGAEVLSALQRKDYQGAVGALAQIKARATPEQRPQYIELRRQVQEVLVNDMAKSPAAAEAYKVLRIVETGR